MLTLAFSNNIIFEALFAILGRLNEKWGNSSYFECSTGSNFSLENQGSKYIILEGLKKVIYLTGVWHHALIPFFRIEEIRDF